LDGARRHIKHQPAKNNNNTNTMNKRARTESKEKKKILFTVFNFDGDKGFTLIVPEDEIDNEDEANRAKHGDWMSVEPANVLGRNEDTFVDERMNGTKEQYFANESKSDEQLREEERALREEYRQMFRDAVLREYPHRANENGLLDRYDNSDSFGAANDYFENVFLKKHKRHCVCIFGGGEPDDLTGKNSAGATYSGKLSKTMPRHLSTPFEINATFDRYICLNFSNGAYI
jgi:hypothetical protein